jgi:hypothetical protein
MATNLNVCKFCKKSFKSANTLSVHICVKKRRHMEADLPAARIGFRVFQRFFELTTNSKTAKTLTEFIDSSFYIDFVKFGHYLVDLKPINIEVFIDFVIKNGLKIKDWNKEFVYDQYIEDLVKKEPADHAVERSIISMAEWSESNGVPISEFFNKVSANEAAHLIRRGRISPWVLYLAQTADNLVSSFTADHAKMIGHLIDSSFWHKKFKKNADDVEFISDILISSGL